MCKKWVAITAGTLLFCYYFTSQFLYGSQHSWMIVVFTHPIFLDSSSFSGVNISLQNQVGSPGPQSRSLFFLTKKIFHIPSQPQYSSN